jgi:hypothetical protein
MFKKLLAGVITAVLSLGVVALVAGPASAHHNTISAKVVCATDGTYKVIWSVTNSESNKSEKITASSNPSVVGIGTTFGFSETQTFPQFVSTPQDLKLDLTGFWDGDPLTTKDDVYSANSGSISKNSFPAGCLKVTPSATDKPSVCTGPNTFSDPTYTLADVTGVKYTVNGADKAAGTYPAVNGGPAINIVASVTDPKYEITGTSTWTFTFTAPAAPCTVEVEPVTPDFKQKVCTAPGQSSLAKYFIPATTGVIYSVKIDGVEKDTATGWYDVPAGVTAVQIIARGDSAKFYVLKGGTKIYDYVVNDIGKCLVEVKPKTPTVSTQLCDVVNHPGVVPPTTYTLYYVEHVVYQVSTDGVNYSPVVITGDTTFTVAAGTHIWVKADVDDPAKYQSKPFSFDHQFTDPGDCKGEVTPVTPTPQHQYCDDAADPRVVVDGSITITGAANITYYLDGVEVTGLVVGQPTTIKVAPGPHSVTVTWDTSKYKLADGITLPFDFVIDPGECLPTFPLVTPAVTSSQIGCFNNGSYTLSNDLKDSKAVIWTVNGSQVSQGKYAVGATSTVKISVAPNTPDYGFTPGAKTSWTIDFKKPTVCDTETLALTGQSPTGLLIAADLLVVAGLAMFAMRAVRRGRLQTA